LAPDPFFGEIRGDTESRIELILGNRKLRWHGVSPLLTIGYLQREATLEINSYNRLYGRVGLTTLF
jgi:hypothetical protein